MIYLRSNNIECLSVELSTYARPVRQPKSLTRTPAFNLDVRQHFTRHREQGWSCPSSTEFPKSRQCASRLSSFMPQVIFAGGANQAQLVAALELGRRGPWGHVGPCSGPGYHLGAGSLGGRYRQRHLS